MKERRKSIIIGKARLIEKRQNTHDKWAAEEARRRNYQSQWQQQQVEMAKPDWLKKDRSLITNESAQEKGIIKANDNNKKVELEKPDWLKKDRSLITNESAQEKGIIKANDINKKLNWKSQADWKRQINHNRWAEKPRQEENQAKHNVDKSRLIGERQSNLNKQE